MPQWPSSVLLHCFLTSFPINFYKFQLMRISKALGLSHFHVKKAILSYIRWNCDVFQWYLIVLLNSEGKKGALECMDVTAHLQDKLLFKQLQTDVLGALLYALKHLLTFISEALCSTTVQQVRIGTRTASQNLGCHNK